MYIYIYTLMFIVYSTVSCMLCQHCLVPAGVRASRRRMPSVAFPGPAASCEWPGEGDQLKWSFPRPF